jgi:hypothetical protein
MNTLGSISRRTREHLENPAPPGMRHEQIVKLASGLIASGFNPGAIFHQLRPGYGPDVSDAEIWSIIHWSEKQFRPNSNRSKQLSPSFGGSNYREFSSSQTPVTTPEVAISSFLKGFSCDESDLWEISPIRLAAAWQRDADVLIEQLYFPGENINIVSSYGVRSGKAFPCGYGETRSRENWLGELSRNGPPVSPSGIWIRPNPTDGEGIADDNITKPRFALLEFDSIPLSLQLSFIARLTLPISAIIASGGRSLHAWVLLDAENSGEYRKLVISLFDVLAPFGIDTCNRNPSRLSRLPGVSREMDGKNDRRQRLLYLNPSPANAKLL